MTEPSFERLRTALLCGQPDRVPLAEIKVEDEVKAAFLGQPAPDAADREAYLRWEVEFWYRAGYDYARVPASVSYPQPKTAHEYAYAAGGQARTREWAESHAGLVTTDEQFDAFPWPTSDQLNFDDLKIAARMLPQGMKIITGLRGGGIYERIWMLMGFETFCIALRENPRLVARMFKKVGEFFYSVWQRLPKFESVGALFLGDDLAYTEGLMISPDVYRQHLFPWYRLLAEVCRKHDLPFWFHSDGKLWEIIPDLIEIGVNALHPIEPKAMDIREVKARCGEKLCLMGNIDLGYTLTRGSPAEVEAEVRQRIRDIAPGGGYCVGSSNTVTEYVPVQNYRAMIEAALRWGSYPISPDV